MTGPNPDDLESAASRGLRNESRDSLFLLAQVGVLGGVALESVRVRNLSPSGMMAETSILFVVGTQVRVELRGIDPLTGRVVWVTDGRMGIAFDAEVDPRRVRREQKPSVTPPYLRQINARRPGLISSLIFSFPQVTRFARFVDEDIRVLTSLLATANSREELGQRFADVVRASATPGRAEAHAYRRRRHHRTGNGDSV